MVIRSNLTFVYETKDHGFILPGENVFSAEKVEELKKDVAVKEAIASGKIVVIEDEVPEEVEASVAPKKGKKAKKEVSESDVPTSDVTSDKVE